MSCKSRRARGTPDRIFLDGEGRCPTRRTCQRPAAHGWGLAHDQAALERLSCEDARRERRPEQLARLAEATAGVRFDLYRCSRADLDENHDGVHTLRHHGLDASAFLPVLCIALHNGKGRRILASPPNSGTAQ